MGWGATGAFHSTIPPRPPQINTSAPPTVQLTSPTELGKKRLLAPLLLLDGPAHKNTHTHRGCSQTTVQVLERPASSPGSAGEGGPTLAKPVAPNLDLHYICEGGGSFGEKLEVH